MDHNRRSVITSLTQALPLTKGISNQLCFLIVDYFTNVNVWTKKVFVNAQYAYVKTDLASKQRPSLFCYPKNDSKIGFSYTVKGTVVLELHFSFQQERIYLAQNAIQIANLIQLINLNQTITTYAQTQMPGLFWLGKECRTDYSGIYKPEAKIILELDFHVDLLAYQRGLQALGCDITSPDEAIYVAAQALLAEVAILDKELEPVIID